MERSLRKSGSVEEMKSWYVRIDGDNLKNEALGHVCWRLKKTDFDGAADRLRVRSTNGVTSQPSPATWPPNTRQETPQKVWNVT